MNRLVGWSLALVLSGTVLAGCSGGDGDLPPAGGPEVTGTPTPAVTPTPSPSASAYLPVPDDVELTAQGSELEVGESAVVAWQPRQGRDQVGVLDIEVTGLVRTTLEESFDGWQLGKQLRDSRPFFVEATIRNVGETDLGGVDVPLYLLDDNDTLVQASEFAERFAPCPSTPFPKKFAPGDEVETCLVYLVPDGGRLEAVSFRPTQEFNPITWTGRVRPLPDQRQGGRQDR